MASMARVWLVSAVVALTAGGCGVGQAPTPTDRVAASGPGESGDVAPLPFSSGRTTDGPISTVAPTAPPGTATSPPPSPGPTDVTSVGAVTQAIVAGLHEGDADRLAGLMGTSFVIGYWASEGDAYPPSVAAQLLLDERGPDGSVELRPENDPAAVVGQGWQDMFGPAVTVEAAFVLDGWGDDGHGTAVAYLTRADTGRLVWYGIVINRLGRVIGD